MCDVEADAAPAIVARQLENALEAAAGTRRARTCAVIDRVAAEAAAAFKLTRPDGADDDSEQRSVWAKKGGVAAAEEAEAGFALEREGWRLLLRSRDQELRRLRGALVLA